MYPTIARSRAQLNNESFALKPRDSFIRAVRSDIERSDKKMELAALEIGVDASTVSSWRSGRIDMQAGKKMQLILPIRADNRAFFMVFSIIIHRPFLSNYYLWH